MKDLRTIILAAGKGTRMKSKVPKVLHPLCGKALLRYVLDNAKAVGSLKTYVVVGHKSDKIRDYIGKEATAIEQQKLVGTADAVKSCESYLRGFKGDVLILSGDAPLFQKETIKALVKKHRRTGASATFLTAVVQDNTGYGRIIRGPDGVAVAIHEENDATEAEKNIVEVNLGVYCFKSSMLVKTIKEIQINKKKKEFYLTDIIELLSDRELKVETVEIDDYTEGLGINSRIDLAVAEGVMRQRILKDFMMQGIAINDPQTTYIDANVKIGQDTVILPFTFIEENVRIGKGCVIGPFARLRSGTKIGDNTEIGNFTEVSRTTLGDNCFMKHFSFLGDSNVGNGVNIGAGVVTANFDGQNKNKTQIADNAFIGSDSILVAPVKIGKKALTAAGSVVTRGTVVPDDTVAIGVPAKIKIKSLKQ